MTTEKRVTPDTVTIEAPEKPVTIYQGTAVIQIAAGVDRDIPRRFLSAAIRVGLNVKEPVSVKPRVKRKVVPVTMVAPEPDTDFNTAE